jgi:hypothetical protein
MGLTTTVSIQYTTFGFCPQVFPNVPPELLSGSEGLFYKRVQVSNFVTQFEKKNLDLNMDFSVLILRVFHQASWLQQ